jgi:GTP-binding protein HflX
MFRVVLVGYTNAGKSTLMNGLTRTKLPVADMPFVTLDSTTRRLYLGEGLSVLLTDTVGFVGRLPHHLVASFHATLEEVREADLLLVVADVSTPGIEDRLEVVSRTLESIGASSVDRIVVFNKTDLLNDQRSTTALLRRYEPNAVSISALNHSGFDNLRQMIRRQTNEDAALATSSRPTTSMPIAQSA